MSERKVKAQWTDGTGVLWEDVEVAGMMVRQIVRHEDGTPVVVPEPVYWPPLGDSPGDRLLADLIREREDQINGMFP